MAPLLRGRAPDSVVAGVCIPICRLVHSAACQFSYDNFSIPSLFFFTPD